MNLRCCQAYFLIFGQSQARGFHLLPVFMLNYASHFLASYFKDIHGSCINLLTCFSRQGKVYFFKIAATLLCRLHQEVRGTLSLVESSSKEIAGSEVCGLSEVTEGLFLVWQVYAENSIYFFKAKPFVLLGWRHQIDILKFGRMKPQVSAWLDSTGCKRKTLDLL